LLYLFEDHTLDTDRRELRRGDKLVPVEPQVFDLLVYLIRNRECVVSKDNLLGSIWHGRIVSESALNTRINAVRSAIGDNGRDQRLIKTWPRKGIRFVGTVWEEQRLPGAAKPPRVWSDRAPRKLGLDTPTDHELERVQARARRAHDQVMTIIGVLMPAVADDPEWQAWLGAFQQGLAQFGWIIGRNVRIDTRWTNFDAEDTRKYAAELVALAPEVILATGNSTVGPLLQLTRTVPIVFPAASDPVAFGLVESLARPGGNATGFMSFESGISAKWLELLKEIAPGVKRAAVLRTLATATGPGQFGAIQTVAPSLGVELRPINTHDAGEIERAVVTFASEPNGCLIAASGGSVLKHRELIVALAARHVLPAIYAYRGHVMSGGLMSYGTDNLDQYRRAAGYVDRILKGEKPADLPVQAPTKYELVVNLKTAKALGLEVPPTLLARADEVIE
jgi:putative tryptophan/tyrosine transport system substrate-binding protein